MGTVVSAASGRHYKWGGSSGTDCDGWHLVETPELSIIEEQMPPGTSETRHSHIRARQFFFILEGTLTVELEEQEFRLSPGQGIEIAPGQRHQVVNRDASPVRMLVTSQPPSHGDRRSG